MHPSQQMLGLVSIAIGAALGCADYTAASDAAWQPANLSVEQAWPSISNI